MELHTCTCIWKVTYMYESDRNSFHFKKKRKLVIKVKRATNIYQFPSFAVKHSPSTVNIINHIIL